MAYRPIRRAARADACFTCKLSNAIRTTACFFALVARERPLTISELLPEIMPVKTEFDYAVSTGIGERRCYAEACIQTHLLWLIEEGKVQRIKEGDKICFCRNMPIGERSNNHGRDENGKAAESEVVS